MKIKIYSSPNCVWCNRLKEFLDEHSVEYENIDVLENPEAGMELQKKTGQLGIPVTIITKDDNSEEVIIGFDKERISSLLNIKE